MPLKTISIDELDNFKIDTETRRLFWYEKEIVTTMRLPWWVNISAIATGIGTLGLFLLTLFDKLK